MEHLSFQESAQHLSPFSVWGSACLINLNERQSPFPYIKGGSVLDSKQGMSHEPSEAYSEFCVQSFGTKKAGQSRILLVMAQVTAAYSVQGQLKW